MRNFKLFEEAKAPPTKSGITPMQGAIAFGSIAIVGMSVGATIGTYVFFGTVTLAGAIAVVETQPWLKAVVKKGNKAVDLAILGGSIYAMSSMGVTVAASMTIAGLGFTLVYAPWLRSK